ncbi:uncharacterized protein BDW47DRAFT_96230 [Aspergillus candidus]|uniref:Survival Motor Neuron Gemin2-binding domain-containing protein n=1 Tax=Aspergillus candidus TaxID=41067 RepID=A0A2I2EY87_ASPCN|nr:hypothetical protein BDW47DRAFT_96230 [Aspergillus candidus]PLB33345.1 hypothetical protein BDW47DRAFT_96230 [Aspergillus candidus]
MGKTKNASKPLTEEEIWDDSALVQSWDEAVEEYKLYHSIHAKGENVDDVLREAEDAEQAGRGDDVQVDAMEEGEDGEAVEAESQKAEVSEAMEEPAAASNPPPVRGNQQQAGPTAATPTPITATPMPHPMLSQVQDEGLKNLMMSWYYAGYYTGLYEGQQRANKTDNP